MEGYEILNKMKSILEKNDIAYSENDNSLNVSFSGSTVAGDIDIIIFIHGSFCISYCMTNVRVKMRTQQVAEYINRANFGLPNGYFVLNYHDGKVIYHTSLPLETIMTDETLAIHMMIADGLKKTKQYIPGLIAVELGLQTPEEAATQADNSPDGAYGASDDDNNEDDNGGGGGDDNDDDDDGNGGGGCHINIEDAESFSDSSSDADGTLDETVIDMSASEDCLVMSDILTTTQG